MIHSSISLASLALVFFTPTAAAAEGDAIAVVKAFRAPEIAQASQPVEIEALAVDLNGDGVGEVLGSLEGGDFCGTGGCDRFVLAHGPQGWVQLLRLTAQSMAPLESRTAGVTDLAVDGKYRWVWSGATWRFLEVLP
jgi:hypothetical protein